MENNDTTPILKKTKLIWGVVLFVLGVFGLLGMSRLESVNILYVVTCIALLGVGIWLLFAYRKEKQVYVSAIFAQSERRQKEQQLQAAKRELEQAKVDEELKRIVSIKSARRICPFCGGNTKGDVCEYCGSKLP